MKKTLVFALVVLGACDPEGDAYNMLDCDVPHYRLWQQTAIIPKLVKGNQIRVKLTDDTPVKNLPWHKGAIEDGLIKWVNAMRKVSTVPLITYDDFVFVNNDEADLYIRWNNGRADRAHVEGDGIHMELYEGDDYAIVMHEMGHIIGLDDLYVEENGKTTKCEITYDSAMCGYSRDLKGYDQAAAANLFCDTMPDKCEPWWLRHCAINLPDIK